MIVTVFHRGPAATRRNVILAEWQASCSVYLSAERLMRLRYLYLNLFLIVVLGALAIRGLVS